MSKHLTIKEFLKARDRIPSERRVFGVRVTRIPGYYNPTGVYLRAGVQVADERDLTTWEWYDLPSAWDVSPDAPSGNQDVHLIDSLIGLYSGILAAGDWRDPLVGLYGVGDVPHNWLNEVSKLLDIRIGDPSMLIVLEGMPT